MVFARVKITLISLIYITLQGCGSDLSSTDQSLDVEMYGNYSVPDGASGNNYPDYLTYKFLNITLTGTGDDLILEPETAEEAKIIDRPQILFSEDISDLEGNTYTGATVEFDPAVTVGGKYDEYDLTMTSSVLSLSTSIEVLTGKGLRILIKVDWQNTLNRDADAQTEQAQEPGYTLEVESS